MEKQKQIEEMAKTMCFQRDSCPVKSCVGVNCEQTWVAEALYNAGYRKIPENAVVLTKEEYEKLTTPMLLIKQKPLSQKELYKKLNEMAKYGVIGVDDGIIETIPTRKEIEKETAEKFERLANERIAKEQGERDGYDAYIIDDKAKYDGDIVSFVLFEICKEITDGKV